MLFRPVRENDLDDIVRLAAENGSLPARGALMAHADLEA